MRPRDACGVVVFDKPRGPTSHDVVARARRALGTSRVGHAGTLDPMATGVLVIAVGEATKLVPYLTAEDKTYRARVRFGVETDTLDAEGTETRTAPVTLSRDAVLAALDAETARELQTPPAYSALKIAGRRAHDLARSGEEVDLAPRAVRLRRATLLSLEEDEAEFELLTEKGYYVRAFARDLAERLGTVAHLAALRRTRSGEFDEREALPLDADPDRVRAALAPLAAAATRALGAVTLGPEATLRARQGKRLGADDVPGAETGRPRAWLDPQGALVAVGVLDDDGTARVLRGFVAPTSSSFPPPPSPPRA